MWAITKTIKGNIYYLHYKDIWFWKEYKLQGLRDNATLMKKAEATEICEKLNSLCPDDIYNVVNSKPIQW